MISSDEIQEAEKNSVVEGLSTPKIICSKKILRTSKFDLGRIKGF